MTAKKTTSKKPTKTTKPTPKTLSLLNVGQVVTFGNPNNHNMMGEITSILITGGGPRYEVSWWHDDTRKCEWFFESEFTVMNKMPRQKIGFSDK